ncbi:hypothetical protein SNEBB_004764 [Seison nebaliae]|nr:hypothetical protein SNEBB_004764 [Seison nebaliae]
MAMQNIALGGQSIIDRFNAARFTIQGSQLAKIVHKATTEEPLPPKQKHLEYLISCTHEMNVSIPQLADLLIKRSQDDMSWIVAYKALITIHNLMCYGSERMTQYLASHSHKFNCATALERTVGGMEMTQYIKKYGQYLNQKRESYKLAGYDFCKVKRGREDGLLRKMNIDKLLVTLPILNEQVSLLIDFDSPTSNELIGVNRCQNPILKETYILLMKDLIRLFACYNDAIINLLGKYFDLNKKQCRQSLDLYKQFLAKMDEIEKFLKLAETIGMEQKEIPDLARAPSSLINALEKHLANLEGRKYIPPPPQEETTAMKIIEEEQRALDSFKTEQQTKQQQQNPMLEQQLNFVDNSVNLIDNNFDEMKVNEKKTEDFKSLLDTLYTDNTTDNTVSQSQWNNGMNFTPSTTTTNNNNNNNNIPSLFNDNGINNTNNGFSMNNDVPPMQNTNFNPFGSTTQQQQQKQQPPQPSTNYFADNINNETQKEGDSFDFFGTDLLSGKPAEVNTKTDQNFMNDLVNDINDLMVSKSQANPTSLPMSSVMNNGINAPTTTNTNSFNPFA